ncbi:O-phosphoserine--tRNA ligase [Candidatus Bathyarchaeota archaeon]|nr:MAG: O-phosphoserine--tRNA ligase [Candidatus Bathyarchaeota archaeon]
MVKFQIKKIKGKSRENFEQAWLETAQLLKLKGRYIEWLEEKGRSHPVIDLALKFRDVLLSLGFEEILNPSILEETEVFKQYGPEAPVILDRCFYLAGLPRPDLGLSKETISKIKQIVPDFSENQIEQLREIFRSYKEGKIESDNLIEEMMVNLKIKPEHATGILSLFPDFLKLKPVPSKLILRSHMTALWFSVISSLQRKKTLPIKLFSIGPKYRREQRLDPLHLYESLVASVVVMAEEISLEDGVELTKTILSKIGFEEVKFVVKDATSKYYAPQTEMEVFVRSKGEWIEVGDQGLYSPVALANYDIVYPVFNVGFGVERIAMILQNETDIRKISYPQFYETIEYDDKQLAEMVEITEKPETVEGKKILEAIVQTALTHAEEKGPCQFLAYKGKVLGKNVEVYVYESDKDVKLLGPAALNKIYVYQGNVLGIPEKGFEEEKLISEAKEKGVSTGIRYLDAVASMVAARVEQMVREGKSGELDIRVRVAKHPSDVNIRIKPPAENYITSKNKRIIVKGPTFIGVKTRILD